MSVKKDFFLRIGTIMRNRLNESIFIMVLFLLIFRLKIQIPTCSKLFSQTTSYYDEDVIFIVKVGLYSYKPEANLEKNNIPQSSITKNLQQAKNARAKVF